MINVRTENFFRVKTIYYESIAHPFVKTWSPFLSSGSPGFVKRLTIYTGDINTKIQKATAEVCLLMRYNLCHPAPGNYF